MHHRPYDKEEQQMSYNTTDLWLFFNHLYGKIMVKFTCPEYYHHDAEM